MKLMLPIRLADVRGKLLAALLATPAAKLFLIALFELQLGTHKIVFARQNGSRTPSSSSDRWANKSAPPKRQAE